MIRLGKYRHFKGNEYEVLGVATHSEDLSEMVIYRQCYGNHGVWVRPTSMWEETVEHNGEKVARFTLIEEYVPAVNAGLAPSNLKD